MGNQIQDILFEYIKNVIYSPEKAKLNLDELPEQFHDLGEGMLFLGECVREQKKFGKSLVKGDFEHNIPNVENGIAAPLKEVHGMLKHLVWQSREVAKGDYNQKLDYFGELSDSFNSMVQQLKEREGNLIRKNSELENLQEMFKNITVDAPYYIFILHRENGKVTYLNKKAEKLKNDFPELYQKIYEQLPSCYANSRIQVDDEKIVSRTCHYQVITKSNPEDENCVYMVMNVTDELSKTLELEKIAFTDELTGLHNRRYGQGVMRELQKHHISFSVAFIDVDHLKYCNDVFGHEKGDEYIAQVSGWLEGIPGDKTICRVGGDEFTVIKPGISAENLREEMTMCGRKFAEVHRQPFQKSFSFGVSECQGETEDDISKALGEADMNMYHYKIKHKQKIDYEDSRL